ncbi:hypothetical protein CEXT_316031 [Caerostris extrusa]|uniref:Uncharacterized protein n=1 Tax=Caerostris extrusa TaxID=172846 RepID=A0AAV4SCA2_CAEEX|nr:hypothetical protein CEXT_316031 [Caerostris extrusa]
MASIEQTGHLQGYQKYFVSDAILYTNERFKLFNAALSSIWLLGFGLRGPRVSEFVVEVQIHFVPLGPIISWTSREIRAESPTL